MVAIDHKKPPGSPKAVVGEIDTSAPFPSVKDAVTLFGEVAFSGERPVIRKPIVHPAERVLAKESQLHLAQKQLDRLKEQVKNAETTKAEVFKELERAKKDVEDLTLKLQAVSLSRELAIKQTETAMDKAKHLEEANSGGYSTSNGTWKQDLESMREQHSSLSIEVDLAKQELNNIRQESNATIESKVTALRIAEQANEAMNANIERAGNFSKEMSATQESIEQVKLVTLQAQQEQAKILSEKDIERHSCKAALEDYAKKVFILKNEFDPELARKLEAQLAEATNEMGSLREKMESERASDLEVVKSVTLELAEAKSSLLKVLEEESSLRNLLESLKEELEKVKKEHSELKEKEAETESTVGDLHVKLRKSSSELEACVAEESKARGASEEMVASLQRLSTESETARREAEEMKCKAEELKKEAEAARAVLKEAENSLMIALEEAEAAKVTEASALDQIKSLSERTAAARTLTLESGNKITLSKEEFESLSHKVKESDMLAVMKVAAAVAQVEAVRASEYESLKKLEATQKEIEEVKAETEATLKRAEMAEAAKRAVEGELRKWREREQKKAAKAASLILADVGKSYDTPPQNYKIQNPSPPPEKNIIEVRKLEKKSVSKKALVPNISGIFRRKKNQVEGGLPSYLPGENPV